MIRRFRINAPFLALVFVAGFSACTKSKEASEPAGRLNLQLSSEPVTLDPSRVEDGLGIRLVTNVMEGLMGFTSEGKLVRRLAESHESSADLRNYRFKIRADAKWSDGVAVDAGQVKFAIERALRPETGAKLSGLLRWIEGAEAFARGRAKEVSGIRAKGAEIEFRLLKPVSFFEQVLTLPMTYPLRKDVLAANGGAWDPLRNSAIPTNGPYRIRSHIPDQEILLEATRPLARKAPTSVLLRIVVDESTGASLFERGKLDILTRIPAFDQARYEKAGSVRTVPFQATYFFAFNRKKKPFDRVEFRRAFAAAVQRAAIVKVLGTGESPASSWIARGQEGYFDFRGDHEGRDLAFAPSLADLKERVSAWKGEIAIGFDSSGRNATVVEKVQADLKAAYGWNVRLKNQEWKTYIRGIYADPEMIFRFGWSSPMIDPAMYLTPFTTNDPFSFTKYANADYDRLVEEIVALRPSPVREKKIVEAQRILLEEEVLVVPIYHYVSTFAVGPRMTKYGMSPVGHTLFEEVEMK
jgi:ABC-type oligopeptide transport system substrate-binding subunit